MNVADVVALTMGCVGGALLIASQVLALVPSARNADFAASSYWYAVLTMVGGALAGASLFMTNSIRAIPVGVSAFVWSAISIGKIVERCVAPRRATTQPQTGPVQPRSTIVV